MQARRGFREMRNAKLKQEAVAFYSQHNVTEALEKLLNTMFLEKPEDVYGYMSEYFHRLSMKPVISSIQGRYLLDSRGSRSLALTLQCRINGIDKTVCSYTHPIVGRKEERLEQLMVSAGLHKAKRPGTASSTKNKPVEEEKSEDVTSEQSQQQCSPDPLESLKYFEAKLKGLSPFDQISMDKVIEEVSSAHDGVISPVTQTALSCLLTLTSSVLSEAPSFLNLLKTYWQTGKPQTSVPIPVMSVISGGQYGIGKLKIRSFLVSPSPNVIITDGARYVSDLYKEIGRQLSLKQGAVGLATLPNGSYTMAADKPEQVLELLKESALQAGLELNREISLYIDIGADAMYDNDKKKYEFSAGQWKSAEELVTIYSTLLSTYTGLIGFIDPLHSKDHSGWLLLRDQLGDKCLLISDTTCTDLFPLSVEPEEPQKDEAKEEVGHEKQEERGEAVKDNTTADDKPATITFITCCALSSCGQSLVTNFFKEAVRLKGFCHYLMFSVEDIQTASSLKFIIELAVALRCKFIRLSAPIGTGTIVALSQLIEVQGTLKALNLQRPSTALLFSCVKQDDLKS